MHSEFSEVKTGKMKFEFSKREYINFRVKGINNFLFLLSLNLLNGQFIEVDNSAPFGKKTPGLTDGMKVVHKLFPWFGIGSLHWDEHNGAWRVVYPNGRMEMAYNNQVIIRCEHVPSNFC